MSNLKELLGQASANAICTALEDRPDVKVIRALADPKLSPLPPEDPGYLVVLDTEATGTDADRDELIELGMVKVLYCRRTQRLCSVVARFSELRDPGIPVPPQATRVNHLTGDMLAGREIDFAAVARFIEGVDLVIAHHAEFDRPLVERYAPEFRACAWGCSLKDIDWAAVGIHGGKLDYIAFRLGFFYNGHRAIADCDALLQVLASKAEREAGPCTPFELLREGMREDTTRVYAFGAPFDKKDTLKQRGYRWHDGERAPEKSWYLTTRGAPELAAELAWLREAVYARRSCAPGLVRLDAFSRYSSRLPEVRREYL